MRMLRWGSPSSIAITCAFFSFVPLVISLSRDESSLPKEALETAILIAPPPSFYPRAVQDVTGEYWFAAVETPSGELREITLFAAYAAQSPVLFRAVSTIFASFETGVDVANPHIAQLKQPTESFAPLLLCAFRHHSMLASPQPIYRIQVAASRDNGTTWCAEHRLRPHRQSRDSIPQVLAQYSLQWSFGGLGAVSFGCRRECLAVLRAGAL
jgi:hypothetical protein